MDEKRGDACGCGCVDICRAEEVKDEAGKLADFRQANPGCVPGACACGKAEKTKKD